VSGANWRANWRAHRELHERRAPAYRKLADLVIQAEGKSPQALAVEIAARLDGQITRP
jgi:shikimate kinase